MIDTLKTYIKNQEVEKVNKLISENPDILAQKDENGSTGLLIIAYSGMNSAFNLAKEIKKSFSFHEAIVCGKEKVVHEDLLKDESLANKYSTDGFTPLSLAAFFDQTDIARLLLDHGAEPNLQAKNPSKVNALHSAVAKENHELCKLLMEKGADINLTQMQNVTALHSAAHRGNLKIVKLLVENGANLNTKMDNGDTPLDLANKDGHEEVAKFLESFMKNAPG